MRVTPAVAMPAASAAELVSPVTGSSGLSALGSLAGSAGLESVVPVLPEPVPLVSGFFSAMVNVVVAVPVSETTSRVCSPVESVARKLALSVTSVLPSATV